MFLCTGIGGLEGRKVIMFKILHDDDVFMAHEHNAMFQDVPVIPRNVTVAVFSHLYTDVNIVEVCRRADVRSTYPQVTTLIAIGCLDAEVPFLLAFLGLPVHTMIAMA
mgnify:CR=1 FL=1